MPTPYPLSLSDAQYSAVYTACQPLLPNDRGPFLVALAELLRTEAQPVGDGAVHRAIKSLQREFWRPPTSTNHVTPRHGSRIGEPIA